MRPTLALLVQILVPLLLGVLAVAGLHPQLRLHPPLHLSLLCLVLELKVSLGLSGGHCAVSLHHTLTAHLLQGKAHAHLPLAAACRLRGG